MNVTQHIDHKTGIRYGVIPFHDVLQSWCDESEGDYGAPCCPKCGNEAIDLNSEDVPETIPDLDDSPEDWENDGVDYACECCKYSFDSCEAYGDEPMGYYVDTDELKAYQTQDDCDIFITHSEYYTRAQYCSPCAPGAGYLRNPCDDGPRVFCLPPDWFETWEDEHAPRKTGEYCGSATSCPYPVWRVADDELVFVPVVE